MPTIEIISIKAKEIPDFGDFKSFAFICENKLESHRGLFYYELKENYHGIIVHLGNKEFQKEREQGIIGYWFAGDIIDFNGDVVIPTSEKENEVEGVKEWSGSDQTFLFKFKISVIDDLKNILNRMLILSPIKEILFLTDYQFGPEKPLHKGIISLDEFFEEHNKVGLIWNCMYHVKE